MRPRGLVGRQVVDGAAGGNDARRDTQRMRSKRWIPVRGIARNRQVPAARLPASAGVNRLEAAPVSTFPFLPDLPTHDQRKKKPVGPRRRDNVLQRDLTRDPRGIFKSSFSMAALRLARPTAERRWRSIKGSTSPRVRGGGVAEEARHPRNARGSVSAVYTSRRRAAPSRQHIYYRRAPVDVPSPHRLETRRVLASGGGVVLLVGEELLSAELSAMRSDHIHVGERCPERRVRMLAGEAVKWLVPRRRESCEHHHDLGGIVDGCGDACRPTRSRTGRARSRCRGGSTARGRASVWMLVARPGPAADRIPVELGAQLRGVGGVAAASMERRSPV